ncbi:universal stress protein [Nocardioides astragali]|uniref:Universal stress protein n=1 Tax=Nocardioides astragali TaxID=1776736 RepID=A0ABW2N7P7_9ACTN
MPWGRSWPTRSSSCRGPWPRLRQRIPTSTSNQSYALSPADALVGTSRHASLLVVGSRGLNAFSGMLLGSVSHEVLHRAHCPVAVVR